MLQISRKLNVILTMITMSINFPVLLDKPRHGLVLMLALSRAALQKTITYSFGCTQPSMLMPQ